MVGREQRVQEMEFDFYQQVGSTRRHAGQPVCQFTFYLQLNKSYKHHLPRYLPQMWMQQDSDTEILF